MNQKKIKKEKKRKKKKRGTHRAAAKKKLMQDEIKSLENTVKSAKKSNGSSAKRIFIYGLQLCLQ